MNKSLRLLLSINSVFVLAANLLGPLYAVYIERLGGSVAVVSGTWSVMLLTTTLVNFSLIRFGDRVRQHEYFLIAGFIFRAFAWIGFAHAQNIAMIIFLQVIIGIGEALGSTGFDSIMAEHLDKSNHIRDYAVWKTVSNILAAIATFAGGLIVTIYGFSPMFYFMGVVAILCAIFTYSLPRRAL
jgi:MFS family permease